MHLVSIEEMRTLEAQAEQQYNLPSAVLMENAGKSAAELFLAQLPPDRKTESLNVLILIGPGNNGGDGLVVARHLENAGLQVHLYYWKEQRLQIQGEEIAPAQVSTTLEQQIQRVDYIIDALLGIGRSRPLPDSLRQLLARVAQERHYRSNLRLVAIDLPTGVNADTGEVDPGTIHMDVTITLAYPKQGFFFFPARDYIGHLLVGSIGLPEEMGQDLQREMLTREEAVAHLPARRLESHKGSYGKVMLLCGSPMYPGSAYLAGCAAARVGAGLVTLAVSEKMLPVYASTFHEATFVLLSDGDNQSHIQARTIANHLEGYKVLLLGAGLGQSATVRELVLQVLEFVRAMPDEKRPSVVIDADGLNNLSALEHWWHLLPPRTIITPHPGEMSRLCGNGEKVSGGNWSRLPLVEEKAKAWQAIIVLKGACTLIASPDGRTCINWQANPALATAGSGDVLGGTIAGLLAQGEEPYRAASLGVYLHSQAGEHARAEIGDAGMLAGDLLPLLPRVMKGLKEQEG